MENHLLYEKYRPHKLDEMILPERIKNIASNGIDTNMIFFGSAGIGKTTLARILVQEHPHIVLKGKLGVEELRSQVDKFCKQSVMFEDNSKLKVVYFEEFDRAKKDLQDELKSFIEEHSDHVRFIATCNSINKISPEIKSRFNLIDFNLSYDEAKELKKQYANRIKDIIKKENIEIEKEHLKKILETNFPDFRKILQDIQYYHLSGDSHSIKNISDDYKELFEIIIKGKTPIESWNYLYENFSDNPEDGIKIINNHLFDYIRNYYKEKEGNLANAVITISEYSDVKLPNALDPFVTLSALVYQLQLIFNE